MRREKNMGKYFYAMRKDKKGVIFTVIAIVLAVFFTTTFSARVEQPIDYKTDLVETRIRILNSYVENFFDYADGAGSIAGYSALQGIITDMGTRIPKSYNQNFEREYINCTLTGNLANNRLCPGMINKTLATYLDSISALARRELNINSTYSIGPMNVTQATDAFSIELIANITLSIKDGYANISDNRLVTSSVGIEGLPDPVYLMNGTYTQMIKKNSLNKKEGDWNITDLQDLYYNHAYRNYKEGISIINRIKGNFTPNDFGIESLVNQSMLTYDVDYYENDSMVDYLVWLKLKPLACKGNATVVKINNSAIISPAGFQIDEEHRLSFNVSSSDTDFICPQN